MNIKRQKQTFVRIQVRHFLLLSLLICGATSVFGQNVKIPQKDSTHKQKSIFSNQVQNNSQSENELLAAQYYNNGEYEKALILYKDIYQKNPSLYNYNNYLNSLLALNQFDEAKKLVGKAIKSYPRFIRYQVDLGYVYRLEGNENKANKEYEKLVHDITLNNNNIPMLAQSFLMHDEIDYAILTYQKAKKIAERPDLYAFELAEIYEAKNDFEAMMNEYLLVLKYDFNSLERLQGVLQEKLATDRESIKSETLRRLLLKEVQKQQNQSIYSEMLLWLAIQLKDYETAYIQAKALDKRQKEEGVRLITLAEIALEQTKFDIAQQCYNYVIELGENKPLYIEARLGLLNTEFLKISHSLSYDKEDLLKTEMHFREGLSEFGTNKSSASMQIDFAHLLAFYLNKPEEALKLLNNLISLPDINNSDKALAKIKLADIYLLNNEPWEATLLYQQVEKDFKHEPIGHDAKFRNAKLSFYIGEFEWAQAQLDVLKAATSKLIANDAMELSLIIRENIGGDSSYLPLKLFAKADLLFYQNKIAESTALIDSITAQFPSHPVMDDALFKKASILLKLEKIHKADSLLQQITETYSYGLLADDALFMRARLYDETLNDEKQAMELYKQILSDFPSSVYIVQARKRFRELRGDILN